MTLIAARKSGPPPLPASFVARPDLVRELNEASSGRLTRLIAPPGSGKSVVLAQWAEANQELPIGWLFLDQLDADAVKLATHLVEALGSIDPTVGEAVLERVETTGLRLGPVFLEQLLADVATMPESVLVIEDLHLLDNTALIGELGQFIEQAPPQLHFIVSTRSDVLVNLHRLRERGEVTEIGVDRFALDAAAVRMLVHRIGNVDLDDRQLLKLVDRTEGWVAGIQLAALAMRSGQNVEMLIDQFAGDDRGVADYFSQEVVSRQPDFVQQFIVKTSVLERLAAPLCDAVTGERDGQRMLETVERGGLFLSPLDTRRRWFRFHPLFRDVLQYKLVSEYPDLERTLLLRAANWYLAEGQPGAAVSYLIAARAWDEVTELVLRHGREMWERGEATTAVRWLQAIPERARSSRPAVRLATALLDGFAGRSFEAAKIVDDLESSGRATPGERLFAALIRTMLVQFDEPPAQVVAAADRVLTELETPIASDVPAGRGVGPGPAESQIRVAGPAPHRHCASAAHVGRGGRGAGVPPAGSGRSAGSPGHGRPLRRDRSRALAVHRRAGSGVGGAREVGRRFRAGAAVGGSPAGHRRATARPRQSAAARLAPGRSGRAGDRSPHLGSDHGQLGRGPGTGPRSAGPSGG